MASAVRPVVAPMIMIAPLVSVSMVPAARARVLPTVIVPLASATMGFVVMRVSAKTLNNVWAIGSVTVGCAQHPAVKRAAVPEKSVAMTVCVPVHRNVPTVAIAQATKSVPTVPVLKI